MKNGLILAAALCGFVVLVYLVQLIYVNFSNTYQIIEHTEEGVRACGEGNVAAVTLDGYVCASSVQKSLPAPVLVPVR